MLFMKSAFKRHDLLGRKYERDSSLSLPSSPCMFCVGAGDTHTTFLPSPSPYTPTNPPSPHPQPSSYVYLSITRFVIYKKHSSSDSYNAEVVKCGTDMDFMMIYYAICVLFILRN